MTDEPKMDGSDQAATRRDLTEHIQGLEQRVMHHVDERIQGSEQRLIGHMDERMKELIEGAERRIVAELGRHVRSMEENVATRIAVVDDQYRSLPARVAKLEETVFAPKPRRLRRGRSG